MTIQLREDGHHLLNIIDLIWPRRFECYLPPLLFCWVSFLEVWLLLWTDALDWLAGLGWAGLILLTGCEPP